MADTKGKTLAPPAMTRAQADRADIARAIMEFIRHVGNYLSSRQIYQLSVAANNNRSPYDAPVARPLSRLESSIRAEADGVCIHGHRLTSLLGRLNIDCWDIHKAIRHVRGEDDQLRFLLTWGESKDWLTRLAERLADPKWKPRKPKKAKRKPANASRG